MSTGLGTRARHVCRVTGGGSARRGASHLAVRRREIRPRGGHPHPRRLPETGEILMERTGDGLISGERGEESGQVKGETRPIEL